MTTLQGSALLDSRPSTGPCTPRSRSILLAAILRRVRGLAWRLLDLETTFEPLDDADGPGR